MDSSLAAGVASPEMIVQRAPVRGGEVVIDAGAGSGAITHLLARRVGEEGRVYAIDIQRDVIARVVREAQEAGFEHVEGIVADLEQRGGVPLPAASADGAVIANVLFQSENPSTLLEEVFRLVRPEGWVLVVDWLESFSGIGPPVDRIISPQRVRELIEARGGAVEREGVVGSYHWYLLARTPHLQVS